MTQPGDHASVTLSQNTLILAGPRANKSLAVVILLLALPCLSLGQAPQPQSGQPVIEPQTAGTPIRPSGLFLDASQFGVSTDDICIKMNKTLAFASSSTITPPTVFTIDARSFTGVQPCNSNPFTNAGQSSNIGNVPVRLLLGNVVIVTSVPWYTPQVAHSIEGSTPGGLNPTTSSPTFLGTTIAACGPGLNGLAGITYSSTSGCTLTGVSAPVPQFPNGTNTLTFKSAHGPFPGVTTGTSYSCVLCGGGQGFMSGTGGEGVGWTLDAGGEEIRNLRLDIGGNSNIFAYYTQSEMERSVYELIKFGGFGSGLPSSPVASANAAGFFFDNTTASGKNPGASRNVIRDASMTNGTGGPCISCSCYAIVYEGMTPPSTKLAGGPIIENVNIFDAPETSPNPNNTITDGIWMQGVENPIIGHLHCQGMSGYCEHYGINEPVRGGVFIAHDVLNVAAGLIDLGPGIDNNQTLMTLASGVAPGGANGLLLDEKNGVSISTAAYPVIGEYLPGNLLAGSTPTSTGGVVQGPTLLGHLNNPSATTDSAGTCQFPTTVGSPLSCTRAFSKAWNNPPVCTANDLTSIAPIKSPSSTTAVVFTGSAASGAALGDTVSYHCEGNPN